MTDQHFLPTHDETPYTASTSTRIPSNFPASRKVVAAAVSGLLVMAALVALTADSTPSDDSVDTPMSVQKMLDGVTDEEVAEFEEFKKTHSKTYEDKLEHLHRFRIFVDNSRKIAQHNADGKHTHTLGMNQFGDLTKEEFKAKYTGYMKRPEGTKTLHLKNTNAFKNATRSSSVDWVAAGAVTDVKNQQECGSCWSFSTTGALEGLIKIKKDTLVSLSEQDLIDCSATYGNNGCNGGLMDYAFEYVVAKGLDTESDYGYLDKKESTCYHTSHTASITAGEITGYTDVDQTKAALQAAITQQPVSVAIEADQDSFQFYKSGVLTSSCGIEIDHGVLAVGYGTDSGTGYWKVKNSWGGTWGESGYIRLSSDVSQTGGQCGILTSASYPTM